MLRDPVVDWRELSALYEQAESLEESERTDFLDSLREASHHLLADLERMLGARARAETEGFLEALPTLPAPADHVADDWREGSRVGAYRLARHIGSGGMAEVWLADRVDGAFERQVAIKLLFNHPTRAQRDTFVERFRRERDILASLHHPNIAALHDAGVTPSGQPWLALEYVSGESITAWCDNKRLALRERLQVFRQVLLAVEHAHSNLIIHRDLKPSNILVTEEGEVKLLDFGIAKLMDAGLGALDDTELTRQGGRPLTLQYASPEQLGGRPLTTASDVYSLGVVLYELLSGARPFDAERSRSAAQLEDAILVGNIPPPSRRSTDVAADGRRLSGKALVRALSGDLDAVTCKALSGDTRRRYASVEALRLDVDRWCEGRPVRAQPAKFMYRMGKFYLRHRFGVWSGAVAVSAVLTLGIATVVAGLRAQTESGRAIASRDFVIDLFRLADPERSGGRQMSPHELLEAGRERAVDALAAQPELQADVLRQIGVMQGYVGDYKRADESLSQAASLLLRHGSARDAVLAEIQLAENATYLGNFQRAEQAISSASRRVDSLREDTALLAKFWQVKGFVSRSLRDYPAAMEELTKAVRFSTQAHGESHVETIDALRELALSYSDARQYDKAVTILEDASRRANANPAVGRRDLLAIDSDRAITEIKSGRYATTVGPLRQLIGRCDVELGSDHEHCVILVESLAWVALRFEDVALSRSLLPRLLAMAAKDASPLRQAANANLSAEILAYTEGLRGLPSLEQQLHRISRTEELPSRVRTQAILGLSLAALRAGDLARCVETANEAIRIQSQLQRPDLDLIAKARLMRGLALQAQSRVDPAWADIEGAVADLAKALGADHTLVALYRCNEASVLRDLNRRGEAVQSLESCLQVVSSRFGDAPVVHRLRRLLVELQGEAHNLSARSGGSAPFL